MVQLFPIAEREFYNRNNNILSNGGTITTNTTEKFKGYGNMWLNAKYIANIISHKNKK